MLLAVNNVSPLFLCPITTKIMKKWITIGIAVLVLAGIISFQHERLRKFRSENRILSTNVEVLLGENETYRVNDSLKAVSAGILRLELDDYKRFRADDAAVISSLRGDLKRAQTIITLQSLTIQEFEGQVQDTVILWRDRTPEPGKRMEASDQWGSVWCETIGNEFRMGYESVDSLYAYRHIIPRKFLWWKWGKKGERWEFMNANPNNTILGAEVIEIR